MEASESTTQNDTTQATSSAAAAAAAAAADTEVVEGPRMINIRQLGQWLTNATARDRSFLLKPHDLRLLYLLVLWEYLSRHHHTGPVTGEVPAVSNDEQIAIPETDLVRMVQLMFHNTYYPLFDRVSNM